MSGKKPKNHFRLTKLAAAVRAALPLLAAGAIASPVYAQGTNDAGDDSDSPLLEEVVVRGVRQSLESAQDLKQYSNVVVDSITAQDMGALADRSVTEALQRVPGVAINRFAAGRDPDHFSVEGSGVVIRGLTYVRSEVNGRDSFTANNGRGLSFADVPPELLGGVDVYKTLSADRVEGGIAGSVNLRTRKPFDSEGTLVAFSLESTYSDFVEETTPTGSVLASTRWDTPVGEIGLLGSFVYSQIKSRADRFQISNFAERTLYSSGDVIDTGGGETPVMQVYFPRGAVAGTQEFDRERYGFSTALQWRNPEGDMEATFQFLRSDSREAWTERTVEIATDVVTDQGDSRRVPGTELSFDSSGMFDSGTITGPTGWRDDQNSANPRTPISALQSNNISRGVDQQFVTDDLSVNFKWDVTDEWALSFDYQHVKSTVDNYDNALWTSSYQNAFIDLNGNDLPTVAFIPPEVCNGPPSSTCSTYFQDGNASYADPYNSFYRSAMDHIEASEGTSDAFRVDAEKTFSDTEWLQSMSFGYRFAVRDQTARFSTYNWGSLSEIWGSGGPVWLDDPRMEHDIENFNFDNFFGGETPNPLGDQGRLFYAGNAAENYDEYVAYAKQIAALWPSSNWVPLGERPGAIAGTPFLPSELNPVEETNNAVYFMVEFGNELNNGWNLSGNAGVRYTETHREASGFQVFEFQDFTTDAECAAVPPGQSPSPFCSLPAEVRQEARDYANGASIPFTAELDYDYVLPSLNLKLEIAEGMQFRFGYFKGISAPDFGLTRAYYNINLQTNQEDIDAGGGRPVGRFDAGNPYLEPVESDNIDLTFEWYFSEVGQLSVALFDKTLKNIRTNDIQRQTFTNNGASFDAIVTTAVNSDEEGKIKGYELAYQQTYDALPGFWSNFGLSANYTYVDSSNVPQSTLSETDPDVAAGNQSTVDISLLPLEGLSKHTVNFTPFFETDNWSWRLAYTWRDEFLLTIRDVIVPFQPIVNEATGQLDGSVFYTINDNWKVGIQGVNLTDEVIKTSAIINDELRQAPRGWFMNDRRFSLIVRGTFE
ncbi:MAG TPA: TonB-dependent receptor [Gammaproteobacteria bacterium]